MAKTRLDKIEIKLDKFINRYGFRLKILYGLILLNIGTVVLLRFV